MRLSEHVKEHDDDYSFSIAEEKPCNGSGELERKRR